MDYNYIDHRSDMSNGAFTRSVGSASDSAFTMNVGSSSSQHSDSTYQPGELGSRVWPPCCNNELYSCSV